MDAATAATQARELAARADALAAEIRDFDEQSHAGADESMRTALFRFSEITGGVGEVAKELRATASDLDIVTRARGDGACGIPWGVCPKHGNTLAGTGGKAWCQRSGCERRWDYDRVTLPCTEPAVWKWTDLSGDTGLVCEGHAVAIRAGLGNTARLTRLNPAESGR